MFCSNNQIIYKEPSSIDNESQHPTGIIILNNEQKLENDLIEENNGGGENIYNFINHFYFVEYKVEQKHFTFFDSKYEDKYEDKYEEKILREVKKNFPPQNSEEPIPENNEEDEKIEDERRFGLALHSLSIQPSKQLNLNNELKLFDKSIEKECRQFSEFDGHLFFQRFPIPDACHPPAIRLRLLRRHRQHDFTEAGVPHL